MGIFVKDRELRWGRLIGTIISLVILILLSMASIAIVPVGHVGVHDLFGVASEDEFQPGFHLKNPFASMNMMSVKTQEYTMSYVKGEGAKKSADVIQALTKEGLTVGLDITILYKLTPSEADVIYKTIGQSYVSVIVRPPIRTVIREVVARYEAKQIYSDERTQVSEDIFDNLTRVLEERGIILESVLLRHVQLPTELTKAIEAKLTAEQNIEKRRFEVQVEEEEANRKRIEAQGIADANEIIATSLSNEYLTWYWIENLDTHNSVIYVPVGPGGIPLFREITE